MELKNKVALVTGGSSGIGQAICIALKKEGSKVIFTYNSNEKGAEETFKKLGPDSSKFKVDVTKDKEIESLFEFIKEKYGKLDILINNAGADIGGDQLDIKVWRETFEVDLFSVVNITTKFLKIISRGGRILNVSSLAGLERFGYEDIIPYSAAKSAVNSFTRTLAKVVESKVLINAIAPGYTKTPIWHVTDKKEKEYSHDQLIDRFILPEEIADMAVAIIKNDAMTGEIVVVDGGLSLKTV